MTDTKWEVIDAIVDRAESMNLMAKDRITLLMDLSFTEDQYDMDWERLLEADNFNFSHDIAGIQNHMNRKTCKIEGGFLPRFAKVGGRV